MRSIPGLGGGEGDVPPNESTTPGAGTATATPDATATPTPVAPVEPTGSAADRVYGELAWFATNYRPTVDRYISSASRARSLLGTLQRQSSVSTDDMERLRGLLARVEEVLYEGLVPHFDAEPSVRSFNDENLGRISTFRERGDWDGVKRILGAMEERYRTLASPGYVERTFPVDPIGGQFARLLTADGEAADAGILCYLPAEDYLMRVQADPEAYDGDLAGNRDDVRRYAELLGPVSVGDSRESRAFLTYTTLAHLQAQPVFVQQYRDVDAAASAVEGMFSASGSVSADGTATLGGGEWQRIYYQAANAVTYAHLRRIGRYVLTVAPSRTPWNERSPNWTTALELTWFWE